MKALVLTAKEKLELRDVPAPVPQAGEVLVQVELCSIGGSEVRAFSNPNRPLPHIMGHGFVGTAGNVRVAVNPLQSCGACVCCHNNQPQLCRDWRLTGVQSDGGFAEYVAVPGANLVSLPDTLSWAQAAFVEPFANALNAWDRAEPVGGERVAVVGLGGLGLGVVAAARRAGHAVAVSDPSSSRVSAARQLGGKPIDDKADYDLVFDTFGSARSRRFALTLTRRGGACVLLGFADAGFELNASAFIREQKRLLGSFAYAPAQFRDAAELALSCDPSWVTSLSFTDVEAVLRQFARGDYGLVKAALRPRQD